MWHATGIPFVVADSDFAAAAAVRASLKPFMRHLDKRNMQTYIIHHRQYRRLYALAFEEYRPAVLELLPVVPPLDVGELDGGLRRRWAKTPIHHAQNEHEHAQSQHDPHRDDTKPSP